MYFFIASALVSSRHKTFVEENRWFCGGGCCRIRLYLGILAFQIFDQPTGLCIEIQLSNFSQAYGIVHRDLASDFLLMVGCWRSTLNLFNWGPSSKLGVTPPAVRAGDVLR